jgi:NTE family protein
MKVGLVLGAGGVVGASWLVGALESLGAETGWSPSEADRIVGTSAGSAVGSLCAAGVSPEQQADYIAGRSKELGEIEDGSDEIAKRTLGSEYRLARALPPIGPGSWRMALSTLRHPLSHSPAALLGGWLPRGFIRTDPIRTLVEGLISDDWPVHPSFWAVACDYRTGRRTVFGRDDAPSALIGEAVAASCAIPGFYHPVAIGGRRYVDGGVCSPSNLDLLCGQGLDLVICLNPTSSLADVSGGTPAARLVATIRAASGRRLSREARKLEAGGTEVLLIQPTASDLEVMGSNLMARDRRVEVIEQAMFSTARELRALRGSGRLMPGGRVSRLPRPVAGPRARPTRRKTALRRSAPVRRRRAA